MSNLEHYSPKLPKFHAFGLAKTLFVQANAEENYIELIISIEQRNINVKELSSYLDFIYRIDGIMSDIGYHSYVHYPNLQIEIDEIRFGSLELIIRETLDSVDANKLVIIWLALKYLPNAISNLIDAPTKIIDFLNKQEEYLERKDRRKLRKHIRELIKEEVELTNLDKKKREKLTDVLDEIYVRNVKRIIPSSRFARKFIKSIKLILRKK